MSNLETAHNVVQFYSQADGFYETPGYSLPDELSGFCMDKISETEGILVGGKNRYEVGMIEKEKNGFAAKWLDIF